MLKWLGSLVDSNEKELKRLEHFVDRINSLEAGVENLSDAELRARSDEFRKRITQASSSISERLDEVRQELAELDEQGGQTEAGFGGDTYEQKRLQGLIGELEKELWTAEKQVLEEILPEAFAVVREAARRTIGQRHFDVQLIGGVVLHQGKIAEMRTGEGKTLVATLPLYLNSLAGKGCHLVTLNDYLAKRDCQWMGPIYHMLGVSVACIYSQTPDNPMPSFIYDPEYESPNPVWKHLRPVTRRQAYAADITYGTNNEFGFDYLRDNMVVDLSQCTQRPLHYAIVDEVDNILIDEARTPLIISGPGEQATQKYAVFARMVPNLAKEEDFTVDEKTRSVNLTEAGISRVEEMLRKDHMLRGTSIYDPANYHLTYYLENALKAQILFKRDRDYVVKDGQVIIVDEFTGRLMFGRRYSEGLHQAIEAKEHVRVQAESTTLATVTFQNYFRMYRKLAGMTGTAATEAEEFFKIYKLDVVVAPTHKPMVRSDFPERIYKDEEVKYKALVNEVEEKHKLGQPVLIGTVSIEKSEYLSDILNRHGVRHEVLNAKNHEKEAGIIAQAGRVNAVTVATNMAGRGVDIILGGKPPEKAAYEDEQAFQNDLKKWQEEHDKVVSLGGLYVVGSERHEARRIDNQLRGRSGRQGDPGASRFYVSLSDDIARRFGGERVKGFMEWAGLDENTPLEHSMVSRAIEDVQKRVEGYHFDIRKHLVDYDDIVNKHREVIYAERRKILCGADLKANILSLLREDIEDLVGAHAGSAYEEPDLKGILAEVAEILPPPLGLTEESLSGLAKQQLIDQLASYAEKTYEKREQELGADNMRLVERLVMLKIMDDNWKEHLTSMEHMRQAIGLYSVGQRDPLVAYKKEGHASFESLLANIKHDVVRTIFKVSLTKETAPPPSRETVPVGGKVGRNDLCPCGSGKKYKKCCGK